jgi:hypothetical protein
MKHLWLGAIVGATFLAAPQLPRETPAVNGFWRTASCWLLVDTAPWCPIAMPPTPSKLRPILEPTAPTCDIYGPCQ